MRTRLRARMLVAAALLSAPAAALGQSSGGDATTETQRRLIDPADPNLPWNVLGLVGLLGLMGLRRPSDNDGYTDDPI